MKEYAIDQRRDLIILNTETEALHFSCRQFVTLAQEAIKQRGRFAVALSGGNTPKAIYTLLCSSSYAPQIDWQRVWLFWSDERSVPKDHEESNYKMAMDAGFKHLPIPPSQIFRMEAEDNIKMHALSYQSLFDTILQGAPLDMTMLGMGDDGHTASLFPGTQGLQEKRSLVVANHIPQKQTWRMSLTFQAINESLHIVIYVFGKTKQEMLKKVLTATSLDAYPICQVGTQKHKALWIVDQAAAQLLDF